MRNVLIVEDDADTRAIEQLALECGGYTVTTAVNGADALRQMRHSLPCAVVLDLMMPVMDGLTFLAERRRYALENVPVICVSAGGHRLLAAARALGAVECLEKTGDFDQLCELVKRHCCAKGQ